MYSLLYVNLNLRIENSAWSIKSMARGFIFACTEKSEKEMLKTLTFATNRIYGHKVLAIREGDIVFLYNLDTDVLWGTFKAKTSGQHDKNLKIFEGKYPYYVIVEPIGEIKKIEKASKIFKKLGISWRDILTEEGAKLISHIIEKILTALT